MQNNNIFLKYEHTKERNIVMSLKKAIFAIVFTYERLSNQRNYAHSLSQNVQKACKQKRRYIL